MRNFLAKLYNQPPREVVESLRRRLRPGGGNAVERASARTHDELRRRFARYTTDHLVNVDPDEFRQSLQESIGAVDATAEGYAEIELDRQRDLSIKFRWGHDHDFGTFRLDVQMRDRHLRLMADFTALFLSLPENHPVGGGDRGPVTPDRSDEPSR